MKTETEIRKKLYVVKGYRNYALKTGSDTYKSWCKVVKTLEWVLNGKSISQKRDNTK